MTGILFFLKRVLWFVIDNWKIVLPVIAILILGLWLRSCWNKHKTKLNERQIVAAQQAIQKQDHEDMVKVLVEAEVQEKQIDANLANSDSEKLKAIYESRRKANAMDNEQLAQELERLVQESQ